jgi:peptide/nickel transport system substrate-binding protein
MVANPATAQKSKDQLNISTIEFFSSLDYYHDPNSESLQFVRNMYGHLIAMDEHTGKFIPELAKSWKRIDEKTIEFELRDDIKFHTGNKFTAADVKHTMEYLAGPKLKIRFKGRYNWVKKVEVLSDYKLRVISKRPFSTDLHTIAYRFYIYDSKVHKSLKNPKTYGRVSASATGVYRALSIDKNSGFLVERWDPAVGKWPHRKATIKRIQSTPIPDRQTQIAALLTGKVDAIRNVTADMAAQLKSDPRFKTTAIPSKQLIYITLDAAGRSKNKAFKDKRVRQAFFKAIPRKLIQKNFVSGAETAELPDAVCFSANVACTPSTSVIAYDPAGAKKLLAEAGYSGGLKFTMTTSASYRDIAEAVGGELRKVGFEASIEAQPRGTAVKRRAKGELTTYFSAYPTFTHPTTTNIFNFFFSGTRDYNRDPVIQAARKKGNLEFDLGKRSKIYQGILDQVNKEAYVYPFSEIPIVWAYNKNVAPQRNPATLALILVGDWKWQ